MGFLSFLEEQGRDDERGYDTGRKRERGLESEQRGEWDVVNEDTKTSIKDAYKLADRSIMKKLIVNAAFVGLWYLFSVSISIYNKWMFSNISVVFPFPLFATSLHMAVQFTLSALILYIVPSLRTRQLSAPDIASYLYLGLLLPTGVAASLDIGLGNMSLKFISLTFLTICKSFSLAFVLLFAFILRLETPSLKLTFIIAAITVGVMMMAAGESTFNTIGFTLVIASAFFSGFRWALTQFLILRQPAASNPFSTLFLLSPIMFISLVTIALMVEGPLNILNGFRLLSEAHGAVRGALLLIFPGILAFGMILAQFALLRRISVVTLNICGILKELVTITGARIVFHDTLSLVNVSGVVITIGSIACYNYTNFTKMRGDIRKQLLQRENTTEATDFVGAPSKVH